MSQDFLFPENALEVLVRSQLEGSNDENGDQQEELAIQILSQSHSKESSNPLVDCRRLIVVFRTSEDPSQDRTLDVCYVIRPEENDDDDDDPKLRQFYDNELNFYSDVMPCLRPHVAPPGFCPELLMHDRDDSLMIFENPERRGFRRVVKQTWRTGKIHAIAKTMARFQAAAWLTDRARGAGRPLHEDHPWLLPRARSSEEAAAAAAEIPRGMERQIRFIERIARDELRKSTKWIRRVITDGYRLVRDWRDADGRLKMSLAHGRTWCSEILFRVGLEPVAWFRDWNMVRYAPLTLDLVQFVYIRCDRNTRLYGLNQIIMAYHEELVRCLRLGGVPREELPSREAIREEFEELRVAGLHYAARYLPTTAIGFETLLSQQQQQQTADNDDDAPQEWLKKLKRLQAADHRELLEHYRNDEAYEGRINELVTEIVRYGEEMHEPREREERREWGFFKRLGGWVEDTILPLRR